MNSSLRFVRYCALLSMAGSIGAVVPARAQELISNGTFSNGLTGWVTSSFGTPGATFGTDSNGPTDTSAVAGNYAFAGGATYNLLQQNISGVTNGGTYRLTFLAGSKSGQGSTYGVLSLFDGLAGNYNSAGFDYRPTDASFASYTVDFVARAATELWLRNDFGGYEAYGNVSVTPIAGVVYAMNYSNSAAGYTEITSVLSGSGKVAVHTAASGAGLTLRGVNTYTGGTEVTAGRLYVAGDGTLGDPAGAVTISDAILDLRNQQTRTGTLTIKANGFVLSGDATGSLVNNGSAFEFQGGSVELPLSGTGGMNITGGGRITSSNSYSGATTISATPGWYGTGSFFLNNAHGLGDASAALTISGGTVSLANNTLTRSGNLTISGGRVHTGTISKSGSNYDIQGGQVDAVLAGTAGLTKSGAGNSSLTASNTYAGGTTINQGALVVSYGENLGDIAGPVTVNSGGSLYVAGGSTVSRTGNLTVDGGSLTTDNANFGTISITGGGNIIASNAAVLAVPLAGTAGLTVGGAGETYLWAPSSYTGSTVINSGQLTLGGSGAISTNSSLSIASGAAINLTGYYAPNNINRTYAGLTGAGILYGGGGTVTINKSADTDTFSGDIQGGQGLIKSGSGNLALAGASSYTGTTFVNEGRLVLAHANALGATGGGTIVASGAQLRINTLADTVFAAEPLVISGAGFPSGGALRNATNNNTWQGAITLAANATIGAGSGTTLTLIATNGATLDLSAFDLVVDGAGTVQVNGGIAGSGQISKTGSGQLVVSNSVLSATIRSNSASVHFAAAPGDGTFAVLSGPLDSASLASTSVTGLGAGQTGTLVNAPNLVVQVSTAGNGYDTWLGGQPASSANQLAYAIGGASSPTSTDGVASTTSVTSTNLSITAIVRTNDPNLTVYGQSITNLSTGIWNTNDVVLTVPADQSGATPGTTQRQTFSTPLGSGGEKFLRLETTLQP